jgi:DNA-binding response OmpR family regulator
LSEGNREYRRRRAERDLARERNAEQSAVRTIPNVVLVESDVEVAAMMEFALVSAGYSVRTFGSGPDAFIELIDLAHDGRARLLLLSVDLIGLDGHTLHEQLKAAAPGSYIVAFLSARGSDADQIRAFTAGAVDYLIKPVSLQVLIAKLAIWMKFGAVLR